jgi:hypothetical protein
MNVSAPSYSSVQSTQRPTQIQQAAQNADPETQENTPEVKESEPQSPTPVINSQGQTTGTILNVTA